jgi:hypothetical protein
MPLLSDATALLVTAIGMGGIFPESAASSRTAHSTGRKTASHFLIAEILRVPGKAAKSAIRA